MSFLESFILLLLYAFGLSALLVTGEIAHTILFAVFRFFFSVFESFSYGMFFFILSHFLLSHCSFELYLLINYLSICILFLFPFLFCKPAGFMIESVYTGCVSSFTGIERRLPMAFSMKEIDNAVVTLPTPENPRGFSIRYDSPVTPRENFRLNLKHQGLWMPSVRDRIWFCPREIPDNIARAFVIDGARYTGPVGGKDMFGIDWEYVPSARGSIVRPGNPVLTDITRWREVIIFPDIESWGLESGLARSEPFLKNSTAYVNLCVFTGWFERLISFMDFGPAAVAVMNRKTRDEVRALFDRLSDLWIQVIDKVHDVYGNLVDGFCFHDDWGAQDGPFFNSRIVNDLLVPPMKRVTDHCHALGYSCDLHSCGKIDRLVGCIVSAGWDSWDGMLINDFPSDYAEYGDRLMISLAPVSIPDGSDPEVSRLAAEDFVRTFYRKDAPSIFSANYAGTRDLSFLHEIYRQSRMICEE